MDGLPFIKMHGLGNDFVVIDARAERIALDPAWVRAVADRRTGVGCDQLIVIEAAKTADARMTIRNADGGIAEACGNGARCIAAYLMAESGAERATIETAAGTIACRAADGGRVTVDMGPARTGWRDIPLAREADTLALDLGVAELGPAVAVNTGVPHAVFFVDDAEAIDVAAIGAGLEHHAMFPMRANIDFAQATARDRIRMRVWERGAGVTRACGTGACAVLVAAARRGLTDREAEVVLDGGALGIVWTDDNRVLMTGPAETSFRGTLPRGAAA
ncbi:MAG: diaminopimelate epimerase [Alphaproteobacteria bacterium]